MIPKPTKKPKAPRLDSIPHGKSVSMSKLIATELEPGEKEERCHHCIIHNCPK